MRRFFCMLLCFSLLAAVPCKAENTRVLFLNVGKADAALVMLPNGGRYLVDTGSKDSKDLLKRALLLTGTSRLDGIFISHTDKDHTGGLKSLLKGGIATDTVYAGALYTCSGNHPAQEAAERYGTAFIWLEAGSTVTHGDCRFTVLGPLTKDEEDDNNNSLVLLLETPDGTVLFTGDMEFAEESALLAGGAFSRADVLKVPHHGKDDACSAVFALTVSPAAAVISTDQSEAGSSAHSSVISRLWKAGAKTYITQDAGIGILVTLDKGAVTAEYFQ